MMKKRRIALVIACVMLANAMLAGCGKSGNEASDENTNTQTAVEQNSAKAAFVGGWPYSTMPTGHFNMFSANAIELKFYRELHQLPLATYVASEDAYEPMLAESWEISEDGTEFRVKLREDVSWRTEESFTSKDVWTTFMIYRLVGNPVWNYVSDMEIVSDNEIVFFVKKPTTLILRYVLRKPMVDYLTYGEYADKVQTLLDEGKTENSEEWTELANDFNLYRPDCVNATGPYYLDKANISESNIELLKNEKSFLADTVQFDKVIVYNGDVADLTPLVMNGEVDFLTHQFPVSTMATFEQMGYETLQVPGVDGMAVYFNEAVKPLDRKEVRQALAYVIDRNQVGELALPEVSRGTKYVSGLGDSLTEEWVDVSKLIDYSADETKAEELLQKAGLSKNSSGQWMREDGTVFTLSLQCPMTWADASTAASEIAQQLTAFGIKTTVEGIDESMRQSKINEGDYQMAMSFFGSGQPHPMFSYETPLVMSGKGLSYEMVQDTDSCGQVDLNVLLTEATSGWEEESQRDAVEKLVLTVNETVPYLPVYTKWSKYITSNGMRTDWGTDDSVYKNSAGDDNFAVIKILNGELKPAK